MRAAVQADLDAAAGSTARYYTGKARLFGATPFGVDWTCIATQRMRFVQLLRVCDFGRPFTVNDLGCGYGALLGFLRDEHPTRRIRYRGVDLSAELIRLAASCNPGAAGCFSVGGRHAAEADYTVASGIFNVRPDGVPASTWDHVVEATLDQVASTSRRGFSVNFLQGPRPGDDDPSGAALYGTDPGRWMEYCRLRLGGEVELLPDYGLAEFTLLVRPRRGAQASARWARSSNGR